jgi:hypothetical protein
MGVHITFVRSTKMDVWKAKEIKSMQLGGNKRAKEFYEQNNMYGADGVPNHKAAALAKYKADLSRKAEAALGVSPFVAAEKKQEETKNDPFANKMLHQESATFTPVQPPEFKPNAEAKSEVFKPKKELGKAYDPPSFGVPSGISLANLNQKQQSLGA